MHTCALSLPFPSSKEAQIACNSLSVDPEPRRDVSKSLSVESNVLSIHFSASEARLLRVAVGSFMEHLILVVETLREFGPPLQQEEDD
ncbi:PREDICTED: EKC/KEOPS complex subunit LAGE3-like [Amphimedon queenslandica]|uniref:L antigen family member 3 n=1 Tax=Amphimedon queenslandica TaxID=400682 RepID=A0A1X7V2Y2_AMPQE|nr:PREDICTED: EKC/KEOPS complex subunit LAGE3-like [Amphimedon queenslandica]|eukprot:XP_003385785.1 PREDICTED: EKC/KEOPS complex subunit LAGE3-like [Amphimedon queenslandica]